MTTAYTSLLGLALPVTGELSGTWGDVVNNYITQYVDAAVAGTQIISGNQTAVTLSTTNGLALSQAGAGVSGSAQYAIIRCTGNPASTLTITAPATSKAYVIINATSTSQDVKVVGAGPTTGVTLISGERALLAWDGSDFVKVASNVGAGVNSISFGSTGLTPSTPTSGAVSVAGTLAVANGGTGQTTYTNGQLLIGNSIGNTLTKTTLTAGSGVSISNGNGSITISATGSGGTVTSVGLSMPAMFTVSNSPVTGAGTLAVTYSGTALPVANGGTGATSASITAFNNITGYTASGATGTTSTNLVFSTNAALTTPTITATREVRVALGTGTNIDVSTASYFSRTITGTTTFTVSNVPSTGTAAAFILDLTNGGSATVNWWTGVKWPNGTAPTLTASGRDVLGFFTYDGGTTWNGFLIGKDVK